MASETINIDVLVKLKDQITKELGKVGAEFEKQSSFIGKSAKTLAVAGVAATAALTGAVVAFGVSSVKAFEESDKQLKQLEAVLESTGGVAGVTKEQVLELAKSFQNVTTYSDEAVMKGENLLLTFTKIGKDVFPQATETMLNMSTALGQDVSSSAIQLGKALQDPILGVTALRRVGVNFNEESRKMIENLVKSGQMMEAQKFILEELATEFGGSATAQAQTFSGQMTILKNKFDDLKETVGKFIVEHLTFLVTAIGNLLTTLDSWLLKMGGLDGAIKTLQEFITKVFGKELFAFKLAIDELVNSFGELLKTVGLNTVTGKDLAKVIGAIVVIAVKQLIEGLTILVQVFNVIIKVINSVINFFKVLYDNIKLVVDIFDKFFGKIGTLIGKIDDLRKKGFEGGFGLNSLGDLLKRQSGGFVPGRIGEPVPIIAHGGEEVIPAFRQRESSVSYSNPLNLNVHIGMYAGTTTEKRQIAKELYQALKDLASSQLKTVDELFA